MGSGRQAHQQAPEDPDLLVVLVDSAYAFACFQVDGV